MPRFGDPDVVLKLHGLAGKRTPLADYEPAIAATARAELAALARPEPPPAPVPSAPPAEPPRPPKPPGATFPEDPLVDQAVEELCAAFEPTIDEGRIRAIGQRVYDARLSYRNGKNGMQQVFHKFEARKPEFKSKLNSLWDEVGSWLV
jgi:hypothetical protein